MFSPRRWENPKTGKTGYAPACRNEWIRGICEEPRIKCTDCLSATNLSRKAARAVRLCKARRPVQLERVELLLPGVVSRIYVFYVPRPDTVQLNDRFLGRPSEMVGTYLHDCDAAG